MSVLNRAELAEELRDLVNWDLVAVHLRGFETAEIEKIKREESEIEKQKHLLYERWLSQCPNATWNDVVTALEKEKEFALAKQLIESILNKTCTNPEVPQENIKIEREDEVIKKVNELHDSFTELVQEANDEIEKMAKKDKTALHQIASRVSNAKIVGLEGLMECQTVDSLFENFRKNCCFIDGSVLNSIVKYGLPKNTELQNRTKEHMKNVREFKQSTTIKALKTRINESIQKHPKRSTLLIKLNDVWDKVTINHVEELILDLTGSDNAKTISITSGSVEVTLVISQDKIMCFNITTKEQQLMCRLGVFYLQIGDENPLFEEDENMNYTFESGFLEAGKVGDIQATELLLNMNVVDINHQDSDGKTALMLASEYRHIEVLKLILSARADVNKQDKYGQTAIMVAKTVEMYETLAQANADTSIVTHKGSTLLMACCFHGNHEVANYLLFTLNHAIITRPDGMTLLMAASYGGNQCIVEYLLTNGADTNIQNNSGETALWLTCSKGHCVTAKILLRFNADPNIFDNDGWTPLMAASQKGHHEIVLMLLAQEVKVDPLKAALMKAGTGDHPELHEANYNIRANDGITAIWLSCFKGHYTTTEILLKHEADPNISDNHGWTPLMIASQEGHHKIVQMLLQEFKIDLNRENQNGQTALMLASLKGHTETVQLLLSNGAKRDSQDKTGITPIWFSCFGGHSEVTKILLQHNANPNIPDQDGFTPLMVAKAKGFNEIVELLKPKTNIAEQTENFDLLLVKIGQRQKVHRPIFDKAVSKLKKLFRREEKANIDLSKRSSISSIGSTISITCSIISTEV